MLDERLIEQEGSPAARAALIARTLADERHRTIAFLAAYVALQPGEPAGTTPVIRNLARCHHRPDLAPWHLRRLAAIVHLACAVANDREPETKSLRAAGITSELPVWRRVAARL